VPIRMGDCDDDRSGSGKAGVCAIWRLRLLPAEMRVAKKFSP
jgi:hypothetical protein